MDIWMILGIEKTDDKSRIKCAYREKLASVNPEDDPDGFMELRNAYEEAIRSLNRKEQENTTQSELVNKIDRLYQDFPNRILTSNWEQLFEEDEFVLLDREEDSLMVLLTYLMDHFRLPCAVFHLIIHRFDLKNRKEELLEEFPEDYISFILRFSGENEDLLDYRLFEGDLSCVDTYIDAYMKLDRLVGNEKDLNKLSKGIQEIKKLPVYHPYADILDIHVRMKTASVQECESLLGEIDQYVKRYPEDTLILFCKSEILFKQKKYGEAIDLLNHILMIDADYYDAHTCLFDIYMELKEYEKAKEVIEGMFQKHFGDMGVYVRLQTVNNAMIESLKEEVKVYPDNHKKKFDLAWCLYQNQRDEEAVAILDSFEPEEDEIVTYCSAKGRCFLNLKKYKQALELFVQWKTAIEQIVPGEDGYTEEQQKRKKRYPYVHALIAECYMELGEYEQAKSYIRLPLLTPHEERISAVITNIKLLYRTQDYQACLKACDDALLEPEFENEYWIIFYRAKACYNLDYLQECIWSCEKVMRLYPYNVEPYIQEIITFQQVKQYDDAEAVIERYRQIRQDSDAMAYYEAVNLHEQKQTEKAICILEKLVETSDEQTSDIPVYSDMLLYLADLYDITDQNEESIQLYRKIADMYPDHPDVYGYLGYMYRKVHNTKLAIKAYKEQLRVRPHAAFYANLGHLYWMQRECEEAYQYYKQSIDMEEREDYRIETIRFASRALLCMNRFDEACSLLYDAIKQYGDEQDENIRVELGLALTRANRYAEAKDLLLAYMEHGTDGHIRYSCASLLMELAGEEDDMETAENAYKKALSEEPDTKTIYSKYGRILVLQGRYDEAVLAYKKAVNYNQHINYYSELLQALYLRDGMIKSENVKYFAQAVIPKEDRTCPLDYVKMARLCRIEENYELAEEFLIKAIEMQPCKSCGYLNCDEGYYELGILYETMGEIEKAVHAYEKAIEGHGHCLAYEKRLQRLKQI